MQRTFNKQLTLTRIFNAPRELVYKAWTDPKHMANWWGPKDFTNPVCEMDVRPGGKIRIDMTFPDGTPHPMTGVFVEVEEYRKLAFRCFAFMDESGNHGLEVLNTAIFEDQGAKTKLTLHAKVISVGPELAKAVEGMNQGWNESLDRLDAELKQIEQNIEVTRNSK